MKSLLSLPLELLQHVAACVETAHWPTLAAFSLTSNACHEASLSVIFRRISITVHDREGLRRDVDALIAALSRTNSFRHVQQITIKGALKLKDKQVEGYAPQTPLSVTSGLVDILNLEPIFWSSMYAVYDEAVIERSSEEDMAWAPMVNLLQNEIPLKDLVYDCQSQFPPSLLRILHEQHSQCRLHHLTFRFRTLLWGVPHPYEMEFATSPSLYRVKVRCSRRDSDGDDDFNQEAMMELNGIAPNINEVTILNLLPGGSLRSNRPRGSWQGLPGFTRGKMGSLKSLSLKGYSQLRTPTVLQDWARHIDFAALQHLTLGGSSEEPFTFTLSGETMKWVAQTQSFPRVKTLCVYLTRDDVYVERPHYSEDTISFFRAFEPLEQLSIDGPVDLEIVGTVLAHHGPTLRKLSLRPLEEKSNISNARHLRDIPFEFTRERVLQIEAQCPVLEDLTIPVKRNKSSASEVELYRCFAKMKKLRSLFLILDCSNWRVARDPTYDPDFGEEDDRRPLEDQPYYLMRRGDLKETFINCAVDEALARSIWETITQKKIGRKLERLKLWTTGEGEYGSIGLPYTFSAIARNLARSWLFELVPRDDREDFAVRELRQEQRKARDQDDAAYCARGHNQEMWEVFRSIWPPKDGSEDWRDDWQSFPL